MSSLRAAATEKKKSLDTDVNGDGKIDLISLDWGSDLLSLWVGNGDGTFKTATTFASGAKSARALRLLDLNGDKKLDLVTLASDTGNVQAQLGNGDGTFGTAAVLATLTSLADVVGGDVNGV